MVALPVSLFVLALAFTLVPIALGGVDGGASNDAAAPDLGRVHVRIARPTDRLDEVVRFYRDGLGLEVLGEFRDHAGFDGVMLGGAGGAYHLEFTRQAGHAVGRAPTHDHLLVFYLPDAQTFAAALARLERAGHAPVPAFNPYWDRAGRTFEDPDGYRVVLQNAAWPPRAQPGIRRDTSS